jgi:hypothetical protein
MDPSLRPSLCAQVVNGCGIARESNRVSLWVKDLECRSLLLEINFHHLDGIRRQNVF